MWNGTIPNVGEYITAKGSMVTIAELLIAIERSEENGFDKALSTKLAQ